MCNYYKYIRKYYKLLINIYICVIKMLQLIKLFVLYILYIL